MPGCWKPQCLRWAQRKKKICWYCGLPAVPGPLPQTILRFRERSIKSFSFFCFISALIFRRTILNPYIQRVAYAAGQGRVALRHIRAVLDHPEIKLRYIGQDSLVGPEVTGRQCVAIVTT